MRIPPFSGSDAGRRRSGTHRPSLRGTVATLAASCCLVLAGCVGVQQDPTDYGEVNDQNEGYYGNWMFGCTGVEANEDGVYDTSTLPEDERLESPDFCTCVYLGLKEENVPFEEMKAFDEAQENASEDDPIELPDEVVEISERCNDDAATFG